MGTRDLESFQIDHDDFRLRYERFHATCSSRARVYVDESYDADRGTFFNIRNVSTEERLEEAHV